MNDVTDGFIMAVVLLAMLASIVAIIDNISLINNAQDKSILIYKPGEDGSENMPPLNGYVAWLTVNGTDIDYPVMQGKDNDEYLNKDPYGAYSLSGSIFIDYRNAPDFSDAYSIIYGHHMEHHAMFGPLDNFKNSSFFDSHDSGELIVDGKKYELSVFAVMETDAWENIIYSPAVDASEVKQYIKNNAMHYREPDGEKILCLSTCIGNNSTGRLVVFCSYDQPEENAGRIFEQGGNSNAEKND